MDVSVVVPSNRDQVLTTDSVPDTVADVQVRRDEGLNRARNAGVENAVHETIIILDDDLRFSSDWFEDLIARVTSAPETVFAARGTGILPTLDWPAGFTPGMGRVMAFRRRAWQDVGGFPVPCTHGGDTDFLLSAFEAGYRVVGLAHEWEHHDEDIDVYSVTANLRWLWFLVRRHPRLLLPRLPQLARQKLEGTQ